MGQSWATVKKSPPIYGEDTINRGEFFDISLFS